ncbi:hypothetical protein FACS1894141_3500 [Spirochaetia bacterium]|nr:hypothetical protein FACS1894141_3500 [Spirochaetia bacterium]
MKKRFVLTAMLSMALAFGLVVMGCTPATGSTVTITPPTAAAPTASPAAGAVASGTTVTLSTTTDGATIYYTTDGSTPTTSSVQYSSPIPVTAALTIKAIAVKSGLTDSSVLTAAYTIASPGGGNMGTATALVDGAWTSGTKIDPKDDVDWYKFEATGGKTYNLTWDDKGQGSGNYTCDIKVSAYQSDGSTTLNGILNTDSGYSTPKIISGYTGTVYIKVEAISKYSTGNTTTGTYAIKYEMGDSNDTKETATVLVDGSFTSGTTISPQGDVDWYTFEAGSGKTYILTWDDYGQGSGNYTGNVTVSAFQSDGITAINGLLNVDSGYNPPRIIKGYTGTVYIKVVSNGTGTYIIKYETGDSNDYKETATALVYGAWTTGMEISPQGDVDWYKFTAASGQTYSLTWDDKGQGSGNYTCDIKVSVYQSDGSTTLNGILNTDSGYSTPKTINGHTGTVYIKVEAISKYSTGNTTIGTYAIKVTQN